MINVKINEKITKTINLDKNTLAKCLDYGKSHGLSLSATIRLVLNDFFLNKKE